MNRRTPAVVIALAMAAAGGACQAQPDESLAGLVVAANGTVGVTDADGEPQPIESPAGDTRFVTASNGRIAVETADLEFHVSDAPSGDVARTWRPLAFADASGRTPAGMDLSPDGRTLAIAMGDPDTAGMELVTVDVETGRAAVRSIDLMANGPPSWLTGEQLALEVIRPDQHSGIATVNATTGDVAVSDAQGYALSATRDGGRIGVVDSTSGSLRIAGLSSWLAGIPDDAPEITSPGESSIQDVAIDADGTRLAVVYAASSDASSRVAILRLTGTEWKTVASIPVQSDTVVSVDWLD